MRVIFIFPYTILSPQFTHMYTHIVHAHMPQGTALSLEETERGFKSEADYIRPQ